MQIISICILSMRNIILIIIFDKVEDLRIINIFNAMVKVNSS